MKPNHAQPTVLVIEPDQVLAEVFADLLTNAGFAAEVITSGPAGLERVAGAPTDVAVIEWAIPRTGGNTILQAIADDERWADTYVVALTSWPRAMEAARDLADEVKLQPFSAPRLVAELAVRFFADRPA
jgi:CheY-like chemotaxis protein